MKELNKPLVSVIIPAYNAERYLKTCLESVFSQTWKNIEVIIVDDGSIDNTPKIALEFESQNVKIKFQKNKGGCSARNAGIRMSSGKYLQFLDADDLISPEKIEKQVIALEQNHLYVAVCSTVHFFDGQDPLSIPVHRESKYLSDTNDTAAFFSNLWGAHGQMSMVQTSTWLIPRKLVDISGMWNENILLDQDGEFFTRIVLNSMGIKYTEGINYYRKYINGNNVASRYKKYIALKSAIESAELKTSYLLKARNDHHSRKAVANVFMQLAVDAYPLYPGLHKYAMNRVEAQNSKPLIPVLGGQIIEFIRQTFGWKTAKRISHEYHKIVNQLSPAK